MKSPRPYSIGPSVGICEKDLDFIVKFQNERCQKICGDKLGTKCTHGCMKAYESRTTEKGSACDYQIIEHLETDHGIVDALVIEHAEGVTTLLFEKTELVAKQVEQLLKYGLSRSEIEVVRRVLEGFPNATIAAQLFISKQTLRTHLKNIYKKLPVDIKDQILKATRRTRGSSRRG